MSEGALGLERHGLGSELPQEIHFAVVDGLHARMMIDSRVVTCEALYVKERRNIVDLKWFCVCCLVDVVANVSGLLILIGQPEKGEIILVFVDDEVVHFRPILSLPCSPLESIV